MQERRRFDRKPTSIRVEITHPALGTVTGYTQDISDGGAAVLIENQPSPPVGTVVKVRFKRFAGAINEEAVAMKVIRQERNVVALMFAPETAVES